jgi:hypothetical protein
VTELAGQLTGALDQLNQTVVAATIDAMAGLDEAVKTMIDLANVLNPHDPKAMFDLIGPLRDPDRALILDLRIATRIHTLPLKRRKTLGRKRMIVDLM